jgi:putative hemolysin
MEEPGRIRSPIDAARFRASVSREPALMREARRLRRIAANPPGRCARFMAEDGLDARGEHLLVRDMESRELVGACRIVSPSTARGAGGYAAERNFDLAMLDVLRNRMVEVSGPSLHPAYRGGAIMHLFWTSIARYLVENRYDYVIASVNASLADGGHGAASAFRAFSEDHLSPVDLRAIPRSRLPLESLRDFLPQDPPVLLRAYVDMGAWVCGEPALDADLACAAFPLLLPLARMRGRYARHFLTKAA